METPTTDYEQQRNARIGENKKRMQALGLLELSHSISSIQQTNKRSRKTYNVSASPPVRSVESTPRRRSSRLQGTPLPSYAEVTTVKEIEITADDRQTQPEIYTEEHEKLLGSYVQEWELFKDGFAEDGTRIYDSVRGKTCHQCRQKTLGLRTTCSRCCSLRGQFCGDCLFMRYGENVMEANNNKDWVCPGCRGICNCSFCRLRKGWAPTGSMYRLAQKLNYKSVAHYLVMTRRASDVNVERKEDAGNMPDGEETMSKVKPQPSQDVDESARVRRSLRYSSEEKRNIVTID
ncbi:hypothetical protein KP509_07G054500 [Ceratopteris richardii]|uniref:Zinc-finger domain-containing protein n=1 Tax=Ceratopteris richardii TaxID=49495 RepID=A0A8T2UGU5_CERRI|nr:hypothetical protein KP509_07G054500 [Ceratopteris richardii]